MSRRPTEPAPRKERAQLGYDYLWNTAASLMGSVSLVLMLTVVSRTAGVATAGIYSLAITVGQQFQALGMYEVRTYHVTDVRQRFSFGIYHATRIVTVALMMLGILGYALVTQSGAMAVALLVLVASLRFFDAYEDVYYSEFQRAGRLDIGGRASFLRTLATTVVFSVMLVATRNLLASTIVTLLVSLVVMVAAFLPASKAMFSIAPHWSWSQIRAVLLECLSLFLASFLSMYLVSAPRYATAYYLDDEAVGYFAILYMPAVAINLLSLLVFRPLLTRMARRWVEADHSGFYAVVRRALLTVLGASVLVAAAAWLIGVPLLGLVFHVDVSPYRPELMVLVLGGALNSVSVVLYYALTTMRRQNLVFVGYVLAAVAITVACVVLVPRLELMGACLAYVISMATLCASFALGMVRRSPAGRRSPLEESA